MDFLLKNKWAGFGAVAILVAGLGYYYTTSSGSGALLTAGDTGTSEVSQEILMTLSQLRTIRLDPELFADPLFVSLTDFGVTIPPQQAGRRNPFAPIGAPPASSATPASTPTP